MGMFALEHIFTFLFITTSSTCNYIDLTIKTPTIPLGTVSVKVAVSEDVNSTPRLDKKIIIL